MTRKWRTPKSESPEFFFTSYLGQGSSLVQRRSLNLKKKIRSYSYITEICDGTGERDPKVRRFRKNFFELFRQRVNFGRKQKDDLKKFVPEGKPTPPHFLQIKVEKHCELLMRSLMTMTWQMPNFWHSQLLWAVNRALIEVLTISSLFPLFTVSP